MATMSSSANVNCFDLSNMIDELCRRYAQFRVMFTLLIPTHFFKIVYVGKSESSNTDSEIYIEICRHNKGFHHPILDSLKSCFRLVRLIPVVCNIKRRINTVEPACATIFLKRPPPVSNHLSKTPNYSCQISTVEPLVNDHPS